MKRVTQRKAKQGIRGALHSSCDLHSARKHASQDIGNKTRTSAAMLGLALSVGASGSVMPYLGKRAVAAEPSINGASSVQNGASVSGLSTGHSDASTHVVREGETLWSIAAYYGIGDDVLIAENNFESDIVLSVGQAVRIPYVHVEPELNLDEPALVSNVAQAPVDKDDFVQPSDLVEQSDLNENLAYLQVQDASSKVVKVDLFEDKLQQASFKDELALAQSGEIVVSELDSQRPYVSAAEDESASRLAAVVSTDSSATPYQQDQIIEQPSQRGVGSLVEPVSASVDEALMVAESIAFSGVEDEGIGVSDPSVTTFQESNFGAGTHQIQVGETLADIARRYNISTQQLANANGIRNPNRIFAGRVLTLPTATRGQTSESSSVELLSPESSGLAEGDDSAGEELLISASDNVQSSQVVSGDFYVQRLLSEMEVLVEQRRGQSSPILPDADVSVSLPEPYAESLAYVPQESGSVAEVNSTQENVLPVADGNISGDAESDALAFDPLFSLDEAAEPIEEVRSTNSSNQSLQSLADEPKYVAAAPLGVENYIPLEQPVTGRMVSPDLPPLLGPDNYLPTGPGSFNGYTYPAQGTLTSGYGWRWGRMHRGIDVAAPIGTPIVAAAPGVIEFAGWNSGGYGNMVDIRHPDGSRTRYAHNNRNLVRVGQRVSQGEQIAEMGSTGFSTGSHVHFEIHLPEQGTVNPIAYLSR